MDSPLRVLLVEDDPIEALLVETALAQEVQPAFEVARAGCLEEACQRLAGADLDVVVLDLMLPDAQELDALAGVLAAAPGVPVVVHTGEDDLALAVDLVRHGADDVLVKGAPGRGSLARALVLAAARRLQTGEDG